MYLSISLPCNMSGKLVTCPYNRAHVMPPDRLQWHLTMVCKDMRANAHLYSICPYNATHHVQTVKLDDHVHRCPDRTKAEEKAEEMKEIQAALGPADDAWESSWPQDKRNLNAEYIPAAAKKKQRPNVEARNTNEAWSDPVPSNPYLTAGRPEPSPPAVPAEEDGWVTLGPKHRDRRPELNFSDPPEVSLAQMQVAASKGKRGNRH